MLSKRSGKLVPSFDLIAQDIMDGYVERLESQEEVSEQEGKASPLTMVLSWSIS